MDLRLTMLTAWAHRETRPEAVAVTRVAIGIAAMLKALERAPVLERLNDPAIIRVPYVLDQPSIADIPAVATVIVWVALAAGFAAGAWTRWTGGALTVLLLSVLFSDQQLYSNHLYLLVWFVGLLTVADSGAAHSVDALLGRGRRAVAAWPVFLLRLQLSVVYLFAGLSKLNAVYLSGTVIAGTLRRDGLLSFPGEWRTFELMAAAAIISILVEIGLAFALWVPRWRRAGFVVGLGLHVAIAAWFAPTLPLVIFGVIALGAYVVFLDLEPRAMTVVFDDSCGFCRRWVQWFRRLDWLRVLEFTKGSNERALAGLDVPREDADRALQAIQGGRRSQGFDAVIAVLERLPISFLWAPLLRLWPILPAGRRAYARVAARRRCTIDPAAAHSRATALGEAGRFGGG